MATKKSKPPVRTLKLFEYTDENVKPRTAVSVWVVDRFNLDETMDFDADDQIASAKAWTAYASPEVAMAVIEKDVRQEFKDAKEDDPETYEDEGLAKFKFTWKHGTTDGCPSWHLNTPHDGSEYIVREIPMYVSSQRE